jgi:UDP-glucose 4-epimerase
MNKIKGTVILITGGAGFLGSHLAEQLLPFGPKKIYILDNLYRGSLDNLRDLLNNPRIEFIHDDICNKKIVNSLMFKSNYCFHLAALRINACAADPQKAFEVMIKGTFDVIEAAHQNNIKKFIYSSSASVYGLAQHFPTPETDNPYDNQTIYGAAKLFGEQILRSYHYMYGLNYIALRYFNIFGPRMDMEGKYTEVFIKWLDCIRDSQNPVIHGDGSETMDFVYVIDVAHANILALKSEVTNEVFNIGTGHETSLKKLLTSLLKVNRSNLKPQFVLVKKINPVRRRLAGIKKANTMLGYKPEVSLEDGLKRLSVWYFEKSNGKHII